ncbi:MAG: TatD family hydrolase [Proteobacteria bacterium]|nr:TatD family hydrolase [Pseudomonadota bacterium]MBU1595720.1 TatD family hydrolase [Pseudomonadota bacterium]
MSKNKSPRPEPESLGLPPCGVDSHAHLDMEDFDADREEILDRALNSGVARTGNVFLGPEAYRKNRHLFAHRPEIFFLLGIHPGDADQYSPEAVSAMRQAFQSDPRLRAVGEIGLDFYWDAHPRALQEQAFRAQLALALDLGLPPVVHCRDAFADTLRVLLAEGWSGRRLLWHCFGGDGDQAQTLLGHGWHLSIPGPASYARNEALHRAVAAAPLERLLLETDCPYLGAEPWRGKRNHPALLGFTALAVARIKNMPVDELWAATGRNACTFFGLEALP